MYRGKLFSRGHIDERRCLSIDPSALSEIFADLFLSADEKWLMNEFINNNWQNALFDHVSRLTILELIIFEREKKNTSSYHTYSIDDRWKFDPIQKSGNPFIVTLLFRKIPRIVSPPNHIDFFSLAPICWDKIKQIIISISWHINILIL